MAYVFRHLLLLPERVELTCAILRPWETSDRAALIRHANNRRVWRNLRDRFPHPYGEAEASEWLAVSAANPPPSGFYAIEVGGEAAGSFGLRRQPDEERYTLEIGYWLSERYWGRGIMTEIVGAMTLLALGEADVFRIFAPVFGWNVASMRVLEKAGYRREAVLVRSIVKDGTLADQVVYAITRDPGLPYFPALPSGSADLQVQPVQSLTA